MSPDLTAVRNYLLTLQDAICAGLEQEEAGTRFTEDNWVREGGGGGRSRILQEGAVFEKAGVGFSHVHGEALPPSATATRPELAGRPYHALGVSLVIHPRNPYVPTSHMNVRFFCSGENLGPPATAKAGRPTPGAQKSESVCPSGASANAPSSGGSKSGTWPLALGTSGASADAPVWWFGGGFDLTPYYAFEEDATHWHRTARSAVTPFGPDLYPRFKQACDDYFFLKHRQEARGVGGIFFDDFNAPGFEQSFAMMRSVGDAFLPAYLPIVQRRKAMPFNQREREFQLHRRGRYVEFNLVWDRGTHFGLQSGGRTESILMSLPPLVSWRYDWHAEPGTPEARLCDYFLKPRDWIQG